MLTKVFNIGESHGHLKRVQESVITHSETSAPMYYLYKIIRLSLAGGQ